MTVSLSSSFLSNLFLGFSHCFSDSPAPPRPLGGCRSPSALLEDGSPFVVSGSSAHVGISVRWFFPCVGGVISESTVGEALECLSSGSLSSCVACGSCRSLGAELEPEVCESLVSLFLLCSLPVVSGGNAFGPSEVGSQLALVVVSWQRVDDGDSTACVCGFVYGVASLQSGVGRFSGAAASFRRLPEPLCVSLSQSLLLLLVISVFLSSAVEALLEDGSPFVVSGSSAHVGISVRWFFPCFGGVISESTVGEALECLSSGSLSSCVACGSCRSLGAELEPEVCESLVSLFLLCSLLVVSGGNAFGPSEVGSQLALVVVSWQRVDDGDSTACVCGFVYGVASLQSGVGLTVWFSSPSSLSPLGSLRGLAGLE
ncbi:hypothetical protein F2Q69_00041322 [Brassica cretica]|uniref:Secreted protein n=1 Tax=Brassica cretica TaxID=69181 RepID=A0A8S9NVU0_BRACR|nr:hypothetical protein F2Q69_00041322 [Brassica cretica]